MEWLLGWFVFSVVVGIVAAGRGRSGLGYFVLSLLLSPLIGLILAIALPAKTGAVLEHPGPGDLAAGTRVPCPQCAELVMSTAKVCRFCGIALAPAAATAFSAEPPPTSSPAAARAGDAVGRLLGGGDKRYPPD